MLCSHTSAECPRSNAGFSRTAYSDCGWSDLWCIRHGRIVSRDWWASSARLLLVLQKGCSLAPVAVLVTKCLPDARRADRAAVLGGKLASLQQAKTLVGWNCCSVVLARTFAGIVVRVYETECCQRDVCRASLRSGAGWYLSSKTHLMATRPCMSIACLDVTTSHSFSYAFTSRVQQY